MAFFHIAISIVTILYVILILSFFIGWIKIKTYRKGQIDPSLVFTSVIIALKNEENNIEELINSLLKQTLSKKAFEVILVNDHSKDDTLKTAHRLSIKNSFLKILNLPNDKNGKKQAINYGITHSKGQLIVTTDTDCTHNSFWLETIVSFYLKNKPKLIIAPVIMHANDAFEKMQALDFFALMVSGAGASGVNQAIMCNGANLAFEKSAYQELSNPHNDKFTSGDDIFLLLNIKKKYRDKVKFLKSHDAIVLTMAEKTIEKFIKQRLRWASKSSGYRDFSILITSFLVLFINLLLLINLGLSFFYSAFWLIFSLQFIAKSVIDFIFLLKTSSYFKKSKLLWYFIPTQLVNIFLVPYFAIVGLIRKTNWKE